MLQGFIMGRAEVIGVDMPTIQFHPMTSGYHKTGSLPDIYTVPRLTKILGLTHLPENPFSYGKVQYEWTFKIDDHECAIWDWKGVRWSCFGDASAIRSVFPDYKEGV